MKSLLYILIQSNPYGCPSPMTEEFMTTHLIKVFTVAASQRHPFKHHPTIWAMVGRGSDEMGENMPANIYIVGGCWGHIVGLLARRNHKIWVSTSRTSGNIVLETSPTVACILRSVRQG